MTDHDIALTGIHIYPVKSLRGTSLREVRVENGRLVGDRDWVLVDGAGRFMHQRDHPQMARLDVEIRAQGIRVRADHLPDLDVRKVRTAPDSGEWMYVQLWRRSVPVAPIADDIDAWFTQALGMPCRLLAFLPDLPALSVPDYEVHSSLQDATPFHLTTEESLADLNQRMAVPIPMERFRPNLVVRGAAPYAEDRWERLRVGDTTLRHIKPCTRCTITMTDQRTGERDRREPLFALSRYRRDGSSVVFGHYLVADAWGAQLRVGDGVSVLAG